MSARSLQDVPGAASVRVAFRCDLPGRPRAVVEVAYVALVDLAADIADTAVEGVELAGLLDLSAAT